MASLEYLEDVTSNEIELDAIFGFTKMKSSEEEPSEDENMEQESSELLLDPEVLSFKMASELVLLSLSFLESTRKVIGELASVSFSATTVSVREWLQVPLPYLGSMPRIKLKITCRKPSTCLDAQTKSSRS